MVEGVQCRCDMKVGLQQPPSIPPKGGKPQSAVVGHLTECLFENSSVCLAIDNSNGQTLPNTSSFKEKVVVAIRPENAILSDDGEITAKVYSKFYLGDCNDLRVDIGNGNILRIIARASTYNTLNEGDEVKVKILDYFVFEDDGKDQIKIMT